MELALAIDIGIGPVNLLATVPYMQGLKSGDLDIRTDLTASFKDKVSIKKGN